MNDEFGSTACLDAPADEQPGTALAPTAREGEWSCTSATPADEPVNKPRIGRAMTTLAVALAAIIGCELFIDWKIGDGPSFLPLVVGVAAVTYVGSVRTGLATAALAAAFIASWFIEPRDLFLTAGNGRLLWFTTFLGCGGIACWIGESIRSPGR